MKSIAWIEEQKKVQEIDRGDHRDKGIAKNAKNEEIIMNKDSL